MFIPLRKGAFDWNCFPDELCLFSCIKYDQSYLLQNGTDLVYKSFKLLSVSKITCYKQSVSVLRQLKTFISKSEGIENVLSQSSFTQRSAKRVPVNAHISNIVALSGKYQNVK